MREYVYSYNENGKMHFEDEAMHGQGSMDMVYMVASEEDGRFYFEDDNMKWETTELIDTDDLAYDEYTGYIYNGQPMDDYIVREV